MISRDLPREPGPQTVSITWHAQVVTTPQTERAVKLAYDEVADTYADHFRSTEPELAVDLAMITHFASLLPGDRHVLDAGCGAGRMLPFLAGLTGSAEGVDLSPQMIRRSRRDHSSFSTQVASITNLPFPDDSFDGVFSWYSTIHSPDADLPRILSEARRVLRPSGLILVAFQSGRGTHDVSDSYRRRGHQIVLHRYKRTPEEISHAITVAGMTEIARLERVATANERDAQGFVIARV